MDRYRRARLALPNICLGIAFLFAVGSFVYKTPDTHQDKYLASLITERTVAIEKAIESGEKKYSFTTNFTPGMGRITDLNSYYQALEELEGN